MYLWKYIWAHVIVFLILFVSFMLDRRHQVAQLGKAVVWDVTCK